MHYGAIQSVRRLTARHRWVLFATALVCCSSAANATAQTLNHPDPWLLSVFPAGAQRGTSVEVLMRGHGLRDGESRIIIDGPPGVSVKEVKLLETYALRAVLEIAPDAPLGRRTLRVHNFKYGLTNARYFHVSGMSEVAENRDATVSASSAQKVAIPAIVNGRIDELLDVDYYAFSAKAGQKIVAAALAHGMDSFVDFRQGYLDLNLELLDARGRTIAAAEDSLGLDPLLQAEIPEDGEYTLLVRSLSFKGSQHAVYRITLGEVPYPTAIFPAGGQRGETIDAEIFGPNVPAGTKQRVTISAEGTIPTDQVVPAICGDTGRALPLARGGLPEMLEAEPNDLADAAQLIALPATINARFLAPADSADWFRVRLEKGQGLELETEAQRHIGSPVDTEVHIFDSAGKQLATNDDGLPFGGNIQCAHDFISSDSFLMFTAPAAGEYTIRVRNVSGGGSERHVYRLHLRSLQPEVFAYQWPAEVPVWGPGGTSTFVVECLKWGGVTGDVELEVTDLPDGWQGSVANWPQTYYPGYGSANGAIKLLVSITAPADAPIGTLAPFRVWASFKRGEETIRREARYLTLYGNSHNDRMHVRPTEMVRAVVADPLDSEVATNVRELTVRVGEPAVIPVTLKRSATAPASVGLVVNGPTPSAGCGWGAPITVPTDVQAFNVPLNVGEMPPGVYGIVVARSWASDLRNGRPGPCTPLIRLTILPAQ